MRRHARQLQYNGAPAPATRPSKGVGARRLHQRCSPVTRSSSTGMTLVRRHADAGRREPSGSSLGGHDSAAVHTAIAQANSGPCDSAAPALSCCCSAGWAGHGTHGHSRCPSTAGGKCSPRSSWALRSGSRRAGSRRSCTPGRAPPPRCGRLRAEEGRARGQGIHCHPSTVPPHHTMRSASTIADHALLAMSSGLAVGSARTALAPSTAKANAMLHASAMNLRLRTPPNAGGESPDAIASPRPIVTALLCATSLHAPLAPAGP